MHTTFPIPVYRLRAGDTIRPEFRDETVVAVSGIDAGSVTVRTDVTERIVSSRKTVRALVPVGRPDARYGLYKADGSGVFGCTCVYRVVALSLPHESVADDPGCPSHGIPFDDEWN